MPSSLPSVVSSRVRGGQECATLLPYDYKTLNRDLEAQAPIMAWRRSVGAAHHPIAPFESR